MVSSETGILESKLFPPVSWEEDLWVLRGDGRCYSENGLLDISDVQDMTSEHDKI